MILSIKRFSIVWYVCFAFLLLTGVDARAGDRVIVVNDRDLVIQKRVIEELNAVGFEASLYSGAPDDSLEMIAEQTNAAAVVRLARKGGNIEVWVADRVTNKTVFHSLEVGKGGVQETVAVIAAVELLRASFMELHAERPPIGKVEPQKEAQAFSKPMAEPAISSPREDRAGLFAGVGLGGATAGQKTGLGMRIPLALTWHTHRLFYIRLNGAFFLFGNKQHSPRGDLRYEPWFAGAEAGALFRKMHPPIYPFLGIGGGVSLTHVEGHGTASSISNSRWLLAPVLYGRMGMVLPIGEFFLIQASFFTGMALRINRVSVFGEEVARLGEPLLSFDILASFVLW